MLHVAAGRDIVDENAEMAVTTGQILDLLRRVAGDLQDRHDALLGRQLDVHTRVGHDLRFAGHWGDPPGSSDLPDQNNNRISDPSKWWKVNKERTNDRVHPTL